MYCICVWILYKSGQDSLLKNIPLLLFWFDSFLYIYSKNAHILIKSVMPMTSPVDWLISAEKQRERAERAETRINSGPTLTVFCRFMLFLPGGYSLEVQWKMCFTCVKRDAEWHTMLKYLTVKFVFMHTYSCWLDTGSGCGLPRTNVCFRD